MGSLQLSAISHQLSAIGLQPSVLSFRSSALVFGLRLGEQTMNKRAFEDPETAHVLIRRLTEALRTDGDRQRLAASIVYSLDSIESEAARLLDEVLPELANTTDPEELLGSLCEVATVLGQIHWFLYLCPFWKPFLLDPAEDDE